MREAIINLFNSADMSITQTSVAVRLDQIYGFAIQAVYTGTPTGVFTIQASCYPSSNGQAQIAPGTDPQVQWSTISSSTFNVSGSAGSNLWNLDAQYYQWIRFVYTPSSGSGNVTAYMSVKG